MSISGKNALQQCLRNARKECGFSSAGQASSAIPYSQETIGRHERGDAQLSMDDVITYSTGYAHPELLMVYCSGCKIRQMIMGEDATLPMGVPISALRVSNRLRHSARFIEQLATILDDGHINDDELPALRSIMLYLKGLEETTRELVYDCMRTGLYTKIKNRPPVEESGVHQNHSSQ